MNTQDRYLALVGSGFIAYGENLLNEKLNTETGIVNRYESALKDYHKSTFKLLTGSFFIPVLAGIAIDLYWKRKLTITDIFIFPTIFIISAIFSVKITMHIRDNRTLLIIRMNNANAHINLHLTQNKIRTINNPQKLMPTLDDLGSQSDREALQMFLSTAPSRTAKLL